jgi:SAM-dependent methyltransferase
MKRVANTEDPRFFKIGGLKTFGEFVDAIKRYCELGSARRLLDWGSGCGRVTVHFLLNPNMPQVFGCDIDPEAIAWCSNNLQPGSFSRIEPWPPTPYKDSTLDLVIAHSVFTHLAREVQKAWLAEMKRIIIPGGLFLASTHGEFAALFTFPNPFGDSESPRGLVNNLKNMLARFRRGTGLLKDGICDGMSDPALKGIAPEGYYQSVFQTRAYTIREWSKYFEILEYIERGMGNFQDLVVMRRPA